MNKATIQAFAAGITFSTAVMVGYLFWFEAEKPKTEHELTIVEAQDFLKKKGFAIEASSQINESNKEEKLVEREAKPQNKSAVVKEKEQPTTYSLTIKPGMTSEQIANKLVSEQILSHAEDLIYYLKKNNLNGSIQVGTFIISKEMSLVQIGKTITK